MRLYLSSFRLGNNPEQLLRLLNGGKRTAVILNALDFEAPSERLQSLTREMDDLRRIGLEPTEIDLRDYFGGRNGLRESIAKFDLLWVRGGNVFVLRRAIRQSGGGEIIEGLLADEAVVYGGYSAGVCVLTPTLHGLEFVDDPHIVPEGYQPSIIWDGLGVLSYAVAPHYKSVHPESIAVDSAVQYLIDHHMPFMALRDGEAIVRDNSKDAVVGSP
jgi:dipeptidase E